VPNIRASGPEFMLAVRQKVYIVRRKTALQLRK